MIREKRMFPLEPRHRCTSSLSSRLAAVWGRCTCKPLAYRTRLSWRAIMQFIVLWQIPHLIY